jgi:hypothetical protein
MVRPRDRSRVTFKPPEEMPHDSPFECIAFLRSEIARTHDKIDCHDHDEDFIK